ncbi:MAG TPA: DUF4129 domain-containing protein, partial [Candidatus Eremiobacteraceae bacterium]|nr:DUF4129 domain-containing protein [Candidatus Eremiobacteraceae bacterium]
LRQIRAEKSRTIRARELADLATSVRRAAQPGMGQAALLDPHAETVAILAQRAYQAGGAGPAPAPHETLLQRLVSWLRRKLGELIARIFGATASKPIVGQIVAVLYIALVAAVAIYLISLLVSLLMRRSKPATLNVGAPLPERAQPDALYALGMAAANEGRYAQAISLLFQASLASFDAAGKLPYDGSLTAGEYRRAVRRTLAAASPYFDDIARAFVIAAFAERPISKAEFSAADAAYRSLRPLVAS